MYGPIAEKYDYISSMPPRAYTPKAYVDGVLKTKTASPRVLNFENTPGLVLIPFTFTVTKRMSDHVLPCLFLYVVRPTGRDNKNIPRKLV